MIEDIYNKVISKVEKDIPKTAHLCHFFIMPPDGFSPMLNEIDPKDAEIHVGFFNKETKMIFSYKLIGDNMEKIPEQEIFQKEIIEVEEVKLSEVKLSIHDAMKILRQEIKEKYSDTVSFKTMVVLQKIKDLGLVWNVTVLRRDFKTVNLKIDAQTGEIKVSNCASIIDNSKSK